MDCLAALRMLFTDEHWTRFKEERKNPDFAQGLNVENVLVFYVDDILIYSKRNKGFKLHIFVLEFVFNQLKLYGFILNLRVR